MALKPAADFVPAAFETLGTESASLLFIDLKKDWIPVETLDAVKLELKAASGVKNTFKVERAANGKINGSIESRLPAVTDAKLEPLLSFDTKRKVKVSVAQANKLLPGLKVTAALEAQLAEQKEDVKLTFDYKRANVAAAVQFTLPVVGFVPAVGQTASTKNSLVLGCARDGHEVTLGAELDYSLAKSFIKAINVFFQYKNAVAAGWTLGAYMRQANSETQVEAGKSVVKKSKHVCGLLVHQQFAKFLGTNTEVAAQLEYNLTKEKDSTAVAVAAAWDVAANSRVHVKINTANQVNAIFAQKLTDASTLRFGADFSGETASVTKGFLELSFAN